MADYTGQGGSPSGTGSISEYSAAVLKSRSFDSSEDFTIPAGASLIEIYNSGLNNDITANGDKIASDSKWKHTATVDEVNKKQNFLPAVAIVATNQEVTYHISYTENNVPVTFNTLGQ